MAPGAGVSSTIAAASRVNGEPFDKRKCCCWEVFVAATVICIRWVDSRSGRTREGQSGGGWRDPGASRDVVQPFGLEDNYGRLAVDDRQEAERRDERNSAQAMRTPSLSNLPLNPPKPAGFNSEPRGSAWLPAPVYHRPSRRLRGLTANRSTNEIVAGGNGL